MAKLLVFNTGGSVYTTPKTIEQVKEICKQVNVPILLGGYEVDASVTYENFKLIEEKLA
jgi:NifB/MoaA-like Fe-S oxidoreductase